MRRSQVKTEPKVRRVELHVLGGNKLRFTWGSSCGPQTFPSIAVEHSDHWEIKTDEFRFIGGVIHEDDVLKLRDLFVEAGNIIEERRTKYGEYAGMNDPYTPVVFCPCCGEKGKMRTEEVSDECV